MGREDPTTIPPTKETENAAPRQFQNKADTIKLIPHSPIDLEDTMRIDYKLTGKDKGKKTSENLLAVGNFS